MTLGYGKAALVAVSVVLALTSLNASGQQAISVGDLIYIDVYRQPQLSTTGQIAPDGTVDLPYVGRVNLAGLDESQAAARVSSALSKILRNPRVTVSRSMLGPQIMTSHRTAEMKTEIVPLQGTDAEALNTALQGMSSEGGVISYHEETNSLIITDTPAAIQNIMSAIARLDKMDAQRTQVRIEAKIAEVKIGAMKELGVRWFVQGSESSGGYYPMATQTNAINSLLGAAAAPIGNEEIGSSNNGNQNTRTGRRFVDDEIFDRRLNVPVMVPKTGQMFYGLLNEHVDLGILIDALVADNKAELLANPYTVTVNHKTALIEMLDEFPYTEFGTEITGRTTYSTRFLELGIKLVVTPHIHNDEGGAYVRLELEPEVSFPTGSVNGVPIRSVRRTTIEPLARDGQTVVVGGIYRTDNHDVEQRVPGLGKLPLLGNLFKRVENAKEQTELMVFVTPTIHATPESVTWDRMINLSTVSEQSTSTSTSVSSNESRRE